MKTALATLVLGFFSITVLIAANPPAKVPLYRLVSKKGDHLYTTSTAERDRAIKDDGCRLEGEIGEIWSTQAPGTEPLYRLFKGGGGHYDHFYTANPTERQQAESKDGYKAEGVTGYIGKMQLPGTEPLYRLYSPRSQNHFYTTSEKEREWAEKTLGMKNEGIVGYIAPPPPSKAAKPAHASTRRER